jgi:dihydropyrimidinase
MRPEDVARVGALNTAKVFGLCPRKGALAPGAEADVVIVAPDREAVVDDHVYHCLCETSVYRGYRFRGMARTAIVRGRAMMDDFETVGAPGWGRFLRRGGAAGRRS